MNSQHYDLIIIGGRCAGASLARRLSGKNLRILLLDRATFPSLPNVPSSPFIHNGTMLLLDELGIPEEDYSHTGSKVEHFVVSMNEWFDVCMSSSEMGLKRNYFRGIDRRLFDHTLWRYAANSEGVTAHQGFSVTDINLSPESVSVSGKNRDGKSVKFTTDLIVGADGRYSLTARKVGAETIKENNDYTSAGYFADWENVEDFSPQYPNAMTTYNTGQRFMLLMIPIGIHKYSIATVIPSEKAKFGKDGHEAIYFERLNQIPHLAHRLKNATCTSEVVGMKVIENGYRQAVGDRWVLVGDAAHYKDPSDGQGIYDALVGSKLLANSILDWKHNNVPWSQASAHYQQQLMMATYERYEQILKHVKQNLYTTIPPFIGKTIVKWMMSNPQFQTDFLRYLSRASEIEPTPSAKMLWNGMINDLFRSSSRA